MNLKNILLRVLMFYSMTIFAAEKKVPLMRASFDNGFTAEKATGDKIGKYSAEEINFETLETFLRKGISGKSMFTGISGSGVDTKRFFCEYNAFDNLNLNQGSLTFWVKPLDWKGDDRDFHVFFCAEGKKEWMLVYKFGNSSELLFLFGPKSKDKNNQRNWTIARANVEDWQMNQWHFVACVWDSKFINLYVDGKFENQQKIKAMAIGPIEKIIVGDLGRDKWKNIKGTSLIDELEIYDVPFSSEEIYASYLKFKNDSKLGEVRLKSGKKTPVIDGRINKWEYSFSGTGFFNLRGVYASIQSKYSVSYDDENIYIGVVSPKIGKFYDSISERDGEVFRDDSVEVFLMPKPESNSYFQFIFNSKGVFFDAKRLDSSWNAAEPLKIANSFLNDKWTFEVSIPFKSIGVKLPKDGDKWNINICRTFPAIGMYTAMAPVMRGYHETSNFAELVFDSESPLVNISSIGEVKNDFFLNLKAAAKYNGRKETLYVRSMYKNDGRKLQESNNEISLRDESDEGCVDAVSHSGLRCDDGELDIEVVNSEGKAAYRSAFHFAKEKPFKVAYFLTEPKTGILKTSIKHNTPIPSGNEYTVSVGLIDKSGKSLAKTSVHPEKLTYTIDLPIMSVAPGNYEIEVALTNIKGEQLQVEKQAIAIPSKPAKWMDNIVGITDKIPAPWIALNVHGETVDCWGRKYSFENNIFPSQIVSQGQRLLAEPVFLSIDGKKIRDGGPTISFKEKKRNEVRFTTKATYGNLSVAINNHVEYDGFLWMEMELETKEPMEVKSIALEIPLNSSCSTLVHSMKKGYLYREPGSGKIPKEGWSKNLFKKPIFWVGNEDVGIQWFAENLKGWMVDNQEKSVEIIPQGTKTIIKLNIIDHPVLLSGKRSIAFGLMATPVKPKIKTWRQVRIGRNVQPWFPYSTRFNYPDKNGVKDSCKDEKYWSKNDKRICYYHALYMISPFIPEWPYWGKQWSLIPPPFGVYVCEDQLDWAGARVCLNSTSYRDFYIWKLASAVKDLDMKDLYFDLGTPRGCRNENHACGWKDHRGTIHKTYNILGTRELAKRIYVMMKEYNPDSFIINHMSEEPAMPVMSFADFMVDGELFCKQVGEDKSYYNAFSPEFFRAEFMSRQWGPPTFFIPQFKRSAQKYAPGTEAFWDSCQARKPYRHFIGYMLVHDAKCWPNFGIDFKGVWKIQDAFGWDEKLEFIPYWNKNSPVKVVSPSNHRIMASLYLREGKAMAVVMNDTDKDEDIQLELAHGMFNGNETSISAKDAENGEKLSLDGNSLKLKVPAREYRVLLFEW